MVAFSLSHLVRACYTHKLARYNSFTAEQNEISESLFVH